MCFIESLKSLKELVRFVDLEQQNKNGCTALHMAALTASLEIVSILVSVRYL
jgi:hypothetical protein